MKKLIIVIISAIFLLMGSLLYAETDIDREREKEEAMNSYLGDDYTPRARYSRESEEYKVWHTIEELNRKDEQQRLFDRNFIINSDGEKLKI